MAEMVFLTVDAADPSAVIFPKYISTSKRKLGGGDKDCPKTRRAWRREWYVVRVEGAQCHKRAVEGEGGVPANLEVSME